MNELNVALYKDATPEIITLEEYAEALKSGKMDFHVNFDHATLSLKRDGVESLAHLISLGPLETMLSQLDHLVERISGNEPALLRSGVLDVPEGHFLLVEPAHPGQDEVFVSLVSIPEFPASHWFPAGEDGPRLYAHVLARLEELAERAGERGYPFRVPVGKETVLEALRRNQRAAKALPPPAQPRA